MFYHCLILTLILHKILINSLFYYIYIYIYIICNLYSSPPLIRPRSCRVIYYFDTPALGRRHQSFDRVSWPQTNNLVLQNQIAKLVRLEVLVVYCSNCKVANQQRKEWGWSIMSKNKNDVSFTFLKGKIEH